MGGVHRRRLVPLSSGAVTRAVGIDLSAVRGIDAALLDGRTLSGLVHLSSVDDTIQWARSLEPAPAVIGIDAPQGPRGQLMGTVVYRASLSPPPPDGRYLRFRVCDYELARRGIGLYLSPAADELPPAWIAAGFALFAGLRALGLRLPTGAGDHDASLLEVYPFAAFVTLLGAVPPPKSSGAGLAVRRDVLLSQGLLGLPAEASHDEYDAVAAALTAAIFHGGHGCALGDPSEGLIALPVAEPALLDRYARMPSP